MIEFDVQGHLAVITLNRPKARNAIDGATTRQISEAFDRIDGDSNIWVTIITGAPPVFCAGADLRAIDAGRERELSDANGFASLTHRQRSKPLIAAVNGPALAGGTEIVLACDLVVADASASFGIPEVRRGLIAAAGGLYRLPRVLPMNIALECGLTGDPLSAQRATELGLVNVLTAQGDALSTAKDLAGRVTDNAPVAVRETRRLMLSTPYQPDNVGYNESRAAMKRILSTKDAAEGVRAFVEKRPPNWTGE
jgi:enoyl-CoA hydratase/carnithine racemase